MDVNHWGQGDTDPRILDGDTNTVAPPPELLQNYDIICGILALYVITIKTELFTSWTVLIVSLIVSEIASPTSIHPVGPCGTFVRPQTFWDWFIPRQDTTCPVVLCWDET